MTRTLPARYELWYGRDEPPAERRSLRAGPVEFQLEKTDLRYGRAGSTEVVRRLYVAIRDRDWNTIPAKVSGLEIEGAGDRFAVRFEARNRTDEIDFRWRGAIEGTGDGTVTAELDGVAECDFLYGRIGFCVLHGPNCAGGPYRARTPNGLIEGELPLLVGPQEIRDGRVYPLFPSFEELELDLNGGTTVRFGFEGDLFEMEDQRNWTDGSFKTYSTPLALGFPHHARKGQVIYQRVVMSPLRLPDGAGAAESADAAPRLALGEPLARSLPPIGLGTASHGCLLGGREITLLRALQPDHLRADLHLGEPGFRPELARAAGDASALGAQLELAVFVTDDAETELDELASQLASVAAVARVLVFHEGEKATGARWVQLARDRLGPVLGAVPFAGGTNSYFAELNRDRPEGEAVDAVAFSINPQVHAFDEASIVETAQAQADAVRSARAFPAGKPIIVGPVTLRPRFNPNAMGPEAVTPGELPAQVDPRQMSLFAAAWTLASAKYLAESGAAAVTYYETSGWRGVVEEEGGPPLPERFPSRAGMVFPVYHVLADLAERKGAGIVALESSAPLAVDGIALDQGGSIRLLLACLVPAAQHVVLEGLPDGTASLRRLTETNAEAALFDPEAFRSSYEETLSVSSGRLELDLAPFEVVRIDLTHA